MADNRLVTRPEWASFMNTGTADAPVWSRIGEGFTDLEQSMSAIEYSRHYVHEKTERKDVTGYAPSISYSCDVYSGDPVILRIAEVHDKELVGSDAHVEILNVNLYEAAEGGTGVVAYKRTWSVIPDTKGSGVEALILTGTFSAVGDSVAGAFDPSTKAFTPDT